MEIQFEVVASADQNYLAADEYHFDDMSPLDVFHEYFNKDYSVHEITKFSFELDLNKNKTGSIIVLDSEGDIEIFILMMLSFNDEKKCYEYFCYGNSVYHNRKNLNYTLDGILCDHIPKKFVEPFNRNEPLIYGILCKINFPQIKININHIKNMKIIADAIKLEPNNDYYYIHNEQIK